MDREGCWGDFCTRKLLGMFCPNCDVPTEFMHARKFKDTMTLVKGMYQDSDKGYFAGAFVGKQFSSQRRDFDKSLENMLEDLSASTTKAVDAPDLFDDVTISSDQSDFRGSLTSVTSFNGTNQSKRAPGYSIDVYLKGNKRGSCPTELNLAGCDITNGFPLSNQDTKALESKPRKSYVEYDHALDDLLEDLNASVSSLEKLCEEVKVETMEQELDDLREASKQLEHQMYKVEPLKPPTEFKSIDNCVQTTKVNPSPKLEPKFKHSKQEVRSEEPTKKQKSKSLFSLFKPKPRPAKADFSTSEDDSEKISSQPVKRIKPRKLKKPKKDEQHRDTFDSKPITRVTSEPAIAQIASLNFKPGSHPESAFEPVSFVTNCQVEPQDTLIKIPKPIRPKRSMSTDSRLRDLNVIMGVENVPDEELDDIPSSAFKMQQTSRPRMGVKMGSGLSDKNKVQPAYQSNPVISIQRPEIPTMTMNGISKKLPKEVTTHAVCQIDDTSATTSPMDVSSINSSPCPTCGHLKNPEYLDTHPWLPGGKSASAPNTRVASPSRLSMHSIHSDANGHGNQLTPYENGHMGIPEEEHGIEDISVCQSQSQQSSPGLMKILSQENLDITLSTDDNITIIGDDESKNKSVNQKKANETEGKDIEIWLGQPGHSPCVRVSSSGKSIHIQSYKDDNDVSYAKRQGRDPSRRKTVSSCYEAAVAMAEHDQTDEKYKEEMDHCGRNASSEPKSRRPRSQRRHTYSSTLELRTGTPDRMHLTGDSQSESNTEQRSTYQTRGDKTMRTSSAELELKRSRSLVERVRRSSRNVTIDSTDSSESDRGLQKCTWNGSLPALNSYTDVGSLTQTALNRNSHGHSGNFKPINFTPINKNYTSTFTISNTAFYRPLAGRRSRDPATQKNRSRSIDQSDRKKVTNEEFISRLQNVEEDESIEDHRTKPKLRYITRDNSKSAASNIKQRPSKPFETLRLTQHKPHHLRKSASAEMLTQVLSHDRRPTHHDKAFITLPARQSSDIKIPIPKLQQKINKAGIGDERSEAINIDSKARPVKKEKSTKKMTAADIATSQQHSDTCPWRSIPRESRNAATMRNKTNKTRLARPPADKETSNMEHTHMGHQEENNNCEIIGKWCSPPWPQQTPCLATSHHTHASQARHKSSTEVSRVAKTDPNLAQLKIKKLTRNPQSKAEVKTEKLLANVDRKNMAQVKTVSTSGNGAIGSGNVRNGPNVGSNCSALHQSGSGLPVMEARPIAVGCEGSEHLPSTVRHSTKAKQTGESVNIGASSHKSQQNKTPNRKGGGKYKTRGEAAKSVLKLESECTQSDTSEEHMRKESEGQGKMLTVESIGNEKMIENAIKTVRAIRNKVKNDAPAKKTSALKITHPTNPHEDQTEGVTVLLEANNLQNEVGENKVSVNTTPSTHAQEQGQSSDREGACVYRTESAPCQNKSPSLQNIEISELKGQEVVSLFSHTPENDPCSHFSSEDKKGGQSGSVSEDYEISTASNHNMQNVVESKSQLTVNLVNHDKRESSQIDSENSHFKAITDKDEWQKSGSRMLKNVASDTNVSMSSNEEKLGSLGGHGENNDNIITSRLTKTRDTQAENCNTSASSRKCQPNSAIKSASDTTNHDGVGKGTLFLTQIKDITGTDINAADCDSKASAREHKDHVISQHRVQSIEQDPVELTSEGHITTQCLSDTQSIGLNDDGLSHRSRIMMGSNIMAINTQDQDFAPSPHPQQPTKSLLSIRHRENSPPVSSKSLLSISGENSARSLHKSMGLDENSPNIAMPVNQDPSLSICENGRAKSHLVSVNIEHCPASNFSSPRPSSQGPPVEKQCSVGRPTTTSPTHHNTQIGLDCNLIADIQPTVHSAGLGLQQEVSKTGDAIRNEDREGGAGPSSYIPAQKQTQLASPAVNVAISEASKINQQPCNDNQPAIRQLDNNPGAANIIDDGQGKCANNCIASVKTQGITSVTSSTSLKLVNGQHGASGMQGNVLMNTHSGTLGSDNEGNAARSGTKLTLLDTRQVDSSVDATNKSGRQHNDVLTENSPGECRKKGNMVTDDNCQMAKGNSEAVFRQQDHLDVQHGLWVDRTITSKVTSSAVLDVFAKLKMAHGEPGGACNKDTQGGSIRPVVSNKGLERSEAKTTPTSEPTNIMSANSMLCNTQIQAQSKYTESMKCNTEIAVMAKATADKDIANMPGSKGEAAGVISSFLHGRGISPVGGQYDDKPPLPKQIYSVSHPENETIHLNATVKSSLPSVTQTNNANGAVNHEDRNIKVTGVKPPIHSSRGQFRRYGSRAARPRSLDSGMDLAQLEIDLMRRLMSERDSILYGGSIIGTNSDKVSLLTPLGALMTDRGGCKTSSSSDDTVADRHRSQPPTSCNEMSNSAAFGYEAIDHSQPQLASMYNSRVMGAMHQGSKPIKYTNAAISKIGEQSKHVLEQTLKMQLYKGPIFSDQETQELFRKNRGMAKKITLKQRPKSASGSYASGRSQSTQALNSLHITQDFSTNTTPIQSSQHYPWHSGNRDPSSNLGRSRSFDMGPRLPIKGSESPPIGRYRRRPSPSGSHQTNQRDFDEMINTKRRDARRKQNEVPDPDRDVDFEELENIFEQQLAELQACPVEDCLQKSANNSRPGSLSPLSTRKLPSPLVFIDKPPTPVRSLVKAANLPGNREKVSNNGPTLCNNTQTHESFVDSGPTSISQTRSILEQMFKQQLGLKKAEISGASCQMNPHNENDAQVMLHNENSYPKRICNERSTANRSCNEPSVGTENKLGSRRTGSGSVIGSIDKSRLIDLETMLCNKLVKGPAGFKEIEKCRDSGFHENNSS